MGCLRTIDDNYTVLSCRRKITRRSTVAILHLATRGKNEALVAVTLSSDRDARAAELEIAGSTYFSTIWHMQMLQVPGDNGIASANVDVPCRALPL